VLSTESADSAKTLPVRVRRYGADRPLPEQRMLHAGGLSAILEDGDLRYISAGGVELVRRLYMAVRDRNWDTIEPIYTSFEVEDRGDSFRVEFTAEHVKGDVDFAWSGIIEGTSDGVIRARMNGEPRKPFHRNRIGFCVLHPMSHAGTPATVTTPDGKVEGQFPEKISPHQPFMDMVSIEHPAGPQASCRIGFEGDLFESEDQRNWTDASYKTYSTPLRIPYPVLVEPGTPIVQTVTITLIGSVPESTVSGNELTVEVSSEPVAPMPEIGFGHSSDLKALSNEEALRLRRVDPAHIWAQIDLSSYKWESTLRLAIEQCEQLHAPLELSVVSVTSAGIAQVAGLLRKSDLQIARIFVFPPVQQPITFPRTDLDTNSEVISETKAAFSAAGLSVPIGGGTRTFFTELNRASERLPLAEMDWATYTINPQVHAFDNLSLVENIEAQAATVSSARAIVGEMPLAIGPITLRPRFNPNATRPVPELGPNELPPEVDVRQLSLFAAGWTVGSLHKLAEAGANALTYFETTGWRGLMAGENVPKPHLFPALPNQLFPIYHVFAAIAELPGSEVLRGTTSDPLQVETLAFRTRDRIRVLVANLTDEQAKIRVSLPAVGAFAVRLLDETSYLQAARDPDFFYFAGESPTASENGQLEIELRPFAVGCLTTQINV
jgi:D-apionolactonase